MEILYFKIATDAAAATEAARITILTANQVQSMYKSMNSRLQRERLTQSMPLFDNYYHVYSSRMAPLVGNIKRSTLNTLDAQFEAYRHISEWCSLILPLLKTHRQLYAAHSASKAQAQHDLLQKVLSYGVERMKLVQIELRKIATNLNAIAATFPPLFEQFKVDYDEKSKFFETRLLHLTHHIDGTPTEMDENTAIAELKSTLDKHVVRFYTLFGGAVRDALSNIPEIESELETHIESFEMLRNAFEDVEDFPSIADNPELLYVMMKATENLMAQCTEYVEHQQFI